MRMQRELSLCQPVGPLHDTSRVSLSGVKASDSLLPKPRQSVRLAVAAAEVVETERVTDAHVSISDEALSSCFGTIDFEQIDEVPAQVTGNIPEWMKGTLLMNGCGDYTVMEHMFDGFALLHKLRISEEGVFTSHRFLQTEAYKHYKATGKMKWREFTASPEDSNAIKNIGMYAAMTLFGTKATTDNASVSVIPFGDKVLAVSEPMTAVYEVDLDTLKLGDAITLNIRGNVTTAHPFTTNEGDLVNVSCEFSSGYCVYRQNLSTAECEEVAFVPLKTPFVASWVHDFPATDNYVAIVENPCTYDIPGLLSDTSAEFGMMKWNPDECSYIHLVPIKEKGKVRTFRCPPFFNFHFGNAFESEDGKNFCFDVTMHRDPQILADIRLDALRSGQTDISESMLCRFEIPLNGDGGVVSWKPLVDPESHGKYCDFPTVNSRFRGKDHRYVYMTGASRPTGFANCLVKADLQEGTSKVWHRGYMAAEPTFVEAPNPTSEDDGVVISSVMGADGTNSLVILDAKSWEEVAIAKLPYGVPARFHGCFFKKE